MNRLRNVIAMRISNFALNHVATRHYRDQIQGYIRYGMNSAARDAREGLDAPQPWWVRPVQMDTTLSYAPRRRSK